MQMPSLAGVDPEMFVCRSKFPGVKAGGSWLASMAFKSRAYEGLFFQHHDFQHV